MIERKFEIKISRQCELLGVSRSSHYSALSDISNINIRDVRWFRRREAGFRILYKEVKLKIKES